MSESDRLSTKSGLLVAAASRARSREWQKGLHPGIWPYGLDALKDLLTEWKISLYGTNTPIQELTANRAFLAWHEGLASRLFVGPNNSIRYAGVIWLTDKYDKSGLTPEIRFKRSILRKATRLWCLSKPQGEILAEMLGRNAPPVEWLRFGIDPSLFPLSPYADTQLIVSVGGDIDRDVETTLDIIKKIRSQMPGVQGVIQTKKPIAASEGIRIVPHLSYAELKSLYARAAIIILATHFNWHVSGMTVSLEAASSGRPVIATNTPGFDDYVAQERTGILLDRGDSDCLVDAALSLLKDPDRAKHIGLEARRRLEDKFSTMQMSEHLARWLREDGP